MVGDRSTFLTGMSDRLVHGKLEGGASAAAEDADARRGQGRLRQRAERFDQQDDNEMPERKRRCSGANELSSVALTTKFLAVCERYGSQRLAVKIIIAGRSAGVPGLAENNDWMAWNADEMRAAVKDRQRKRGA